MSSLHRGFQVRQHKPWKLWFGLCLIALMMSGFFTLGKFYQSSELSHLKLERETMLNRIAELESRNYNLVETNAQLEGNSRIEHDAYLLANQTLVELQQQLLEQREKLAFYQGIVSPEDATYGVKIQSFEIRGKKTQPTLHYKLVLTKRGVGTKKIRGSFKVVIVGEDNGSLSELILTDLAADGESTEDKFSFRYFQVFEGNISFPASFKPYEVEISINPSTKKVKSFTKTILWTTVLSGDV